MDPKDFVTKRLAHGEVACQAREDQQVKLVICEENP